MRIIVNWFDVFVQKDDPEHGADPTGGFHRGDTRPGPLFDSLEQLNDELESRGLPSLSEWDEHDDEPGQYHTQKSEDGKGLDITDDEYRADPDRGLFLVDYAISVSAAETRPLTGAGQKEKV